jgi:hypothetical protein
MLMRQLNIYSFIVILHDAYGTGWSIITTFIFDIYCNSIIELWQIDYYISYKDDNICEMLWGIVL